MAIAEERAGLLLGGPAEDEVEEDEGWPTTVEEVAVLDIEVDRSYQRAEIPRHVKEIAETFDKELFGMPELSKRSDGYVALDGQQRLGAIWYRNENELGPPILTIRALVHHGKTPREEALLFVKFNSKRIRVSTLDQWKPRIAYGDETATAIDELLRRYDVTVGKGENAIGAPATLEDIWTGYQRKQSGANRISTLRPGPEALELTISAITDHWAVYGDRFRSDVIAGLGLFFHRFSDAEINADVLQATMQRLTPEGLAREATKQVTSSYGLESRRSACAKTFALAYNRVAERQGSNYRIPVAERFPGFQATRKQNQKEQS